MNETIKAFNYPNSVVKEYSHWIVMLRPNQVTIGSLVIAAKSNSTSLGELGSDEWAEFAVVSKDCEQKIVETFGAEKFNYLALMMKDPNVHFHCIPRYSKPVSYNGGQFIDTDWPLKTELLPIEMDEDSYNLIVAELKS